MNETIKKIDAYLEQFVGSTMEQIIMQEAKREIEKLIKERDELVFRDPPPMNYPHTPNPLLGELRRRGDRIKELIEERDEARREYCEARYREERADLRSTPTSPKVIAANRGWDCFKENNK
jgi:hypothetical protein